MTVILMMKKVMGMVTALLVWTPSQRFPRDLRLVLQIAGCLPDPGILACVRYYSWKNTIYIYMENTICVYIYSFLPSGWLPINFLSHIHCGVSFAIAQHCSRTRARFRTLGIRPLWMPDWSWWRSSWRVPSSTRQRLAAIRSGGVVVPQNITFILRGKHSWINKGAFSSLYMTYINIYIQEGIGFLDLSRNAFPPNLFELCGSDAIIAFYFVRPKIYIPNVMKAFWNQSNVAKN